MAQDYDGRTNQLYVVGKVIDGPMSIHVKAVDTQFENRFVSLREVSYAHKDGTFFQARSVVVMPDGMLVVPVTPEGRLIMVRVFRPGANQWCWEFPQERMESRDGKSEAVRCAQEEAGLKGDPTSIESLGKISSMPDRVTEITHMFAVHGDYDVASRKDRQEIPDGCIEEFTAFKVDIMIRGDKIICPCARSAFYAYRRR